MGLSAEVHVEREKDQRSKDRKITGDKAVSKVQISQQTGAASVKLWHGIYVWSGGGSETWDPDMGDGSLGGGCALIGSE